MRRAPEAHWAASLVSWGSLSAMATPPELILGRKDGRAMLHSCDFPGNRALLSAAYCRVTGCHEALYNPAPSRIVVTTALPPFRRLRCEPSTLMPVAPTTVVAAAGYAKKPVVAPRRAGKAVAPLSAGQTLGSRGPGRGGSGQARSPLREPARRARI